MRFAKSLLVLILVVTLSHVSPLPTSLYTTSLTSLQFLQHVAKNQYHWRNILNEQVINLGDPPYHSRITGFIKQDETDPRVILHKVLESFSNVGSYVEFAAAAVHKSLACYSVKQMAFQSHYVSRMFEKDADPGYIQVELERFKFTTTLILDKLSIRSTDLADLFEFYWESIRLIQYDIIHHARYQEYPKNSMGFMNVLHNRLKEFLKRNCFKFLLDSQFLSDMGMGINYLLMDDVLNLMVDVPVLKKLGEEQENFMTKYYKNLGYEILPKTQWGQVFYYSKPSVALEKMRETNEPITYPPPAAGSPTIVDQSEIGGIPTSGSIN